MSTAILLALSVASSGPAELPPDVARFVEERTNCDHFRGEPHEGNSPEQLERREFIRQSLAIYCSGSDRRLAALKQRYASDERSMAALSVFEESIEPTCE